MHGMIEAVYCINLDRRTDRWARMQERLRVAGLAARRFRALTPAEAEPEIARKPLALPRQEHSAKITACTLSHIAVWDEAVRRGQDAVVVLEDDIIFADGFTRILGEIITSHAPQLLSFDALPAPMNWTGDAYAIEPLPTRFHCTGGYYVTRPFMEACLDHYERGQLMTNGERILSAIAQLRLPSITTMPRLCMQDWFVAGHTSDVQRPEWTDKLGGLSRIYMERYGSWYRTALREFESERAGL